MPRLKTERLVKRMNVATARKDLWRSYLNDAYSLALPNRNLFDRPMGDTAGRTPGEERNTAVYDGTLQNATLRLANRLQSDLTPPFHKWADFVPGPFLTANANEDEIEEARKILAGVRDAVFSAIHLSNFDTSVNEFYLELATGMGVMMLVEDSRPGKAPFHFITVPRAQVAVEDGTLGGFSATYRVHKMDPRDFEERFGEDFIKPDGFDRYLSDHDEKDGEEELREAVYYDAKDDLWYYDVLWKGSTGSSNQTDQDWTRIVEKEMDDTPFIVARWMKVAGEAEGRGPVLAALPDAKTANKVVEFILRNAAFAVSGFWLARNDGILNPYTVRVQPGAVIPVGSTGGSLGASLQSADFGGRFDVAQLVLEDLRMQIKQAMLDNSLPPETGAVRSATEIIARMRDLVRDVGSPFGRLMTEFLRPTLQKVLNSLVRRKLINLDGGSINLSGGNVAMTINSPLAREQDLNDVEQTLNWAQITKAIVGEQLAPVSIKVESVGGYLAPKMGVAPELVRPKREAEQMQRQIGSMIGAQIGNGAPAANAIQGATGGGGIPQSAPQRLAA